MATRNLVSSYTSYTEKSNAIRVKPELRYAYNEESLTDYSLSKNGSVTPVIFMVKAKENEIFHLRRVIFVLHTDNYYWDRLGVVDPLVNGVEFSYVTQYGGSSQVVRWALNFKNFTELSALSEDTFIGNGCTVDKKVLWKCTFNNNFIDTTDINTELNSSKNDVFLIKVQDDLSTLPCFNVIVNGVVEVF